MKLLGRKKEPVVYNKGKIQQLGLKAIKEYFEVDLKKVDQKVLNHLHQRAKIGLGFEREHNINERSIEKSYIKVWAMIASDKNELKELICKSMPKYAMTL